MKKITAIIAILLGVALSSAAAFADSTFYLPIPGMAAVQSIQDQQQYQRQSQRLAPRYPSYMGQPRQYDPTATNINRYLMGGSGTDYRVRPVVRQPMYGQPRMGGQ